MFSQSQAGAGQTLDAAHLNADQSLLDMASSEYFILFILQLKTNLEQTKMELHSETAGSLTNVKEIAT